MPKPPEKEYLNEFHRKTSEVAQKEVAEMRKHPLTREQKLAQEKRRTEARDGKRKI